MLTTVQLTCASRLGPNCAASDCLQTLHLADVYLKVQHPLRDVGREANPLGSKFDCIACDECLVQEHISQCSTVIGCMAHHDQS